MSRIDREIWNRHLFRRPDRSWYIWQFTGYAQVDGIAADVDLNVMRADGCLEWPAC